MIKYAISFFLVFMVLLVGCSESTTNNYYYYPESQNNQSVTNIDSDNSIDSEDHRSFTGRNM